MKKVLLIFIGLLLSQFSLRGQCPTSIIISGPTSVCLGSANIYSINKALGPHQNTVTNPWSVSGGGTILLESDNITSVNWTTLGTYTLSFNLVVFGCASITATLDVTVINSIAPSVSSISGPTSLCVGQQGTYLVTPQAGMTTIWSTLPADQVGFSIVTNENQATVIPTSAMDIEILASYSNGTCVGSSMIIPINVNAGTSAINISGPTTICLGSISSYMVFGERSDNFSWSLSLPSGGTITTSGNNNNIANINWSATGTYILTAVATNTCNTNTRSATYSITVVPPVGTVGNILSQNATLCHGVSQIFSIPAVTNATSYSWVFTPSSGSPSTVQTNSPSVSNIFSTGGSYTLTVTAQNTACKSVSTPYSFSIIGFQQVSPIITVQTTVACINNKVNLSVTPATGYSFTWFIGDGTITGQSNSNTISAQWPTSGTKPISVLASSSCDQISMPLPLPLPPVDGPPLQPISILIQPPLPINLGSIIPPQNSQICLGDFYYSLQTDPISVSKVVWNTLPLNSGSINYSNNTITGSVLVGEASVKWLAPGNQILVATATNSCGNTAQTSIPVQVNNASQPVVTISGNTSVCLNSTQTYTATPSGLNYAWSCVGCQITNTTGNTVTVLWNTYGGEAIYVTPSLNQCQGNLTPYYPSVNASFLNSTLTPPAVCSGSTFTYNGTSQTFGATLTWSRAIIPGIAQTMSSGNCCISEVLTNTTTSPINVTYVYTITSGGCSNYQNVVVTVNPTATVAAVANQTVCSNTSTAAVAFSGNANSYSWVNDSPSVGLPASGTGNIPAFTVANTTYPITATITVTAHGNYCTSTTSFNITINPSLTFGTNRAIGNQTLCNATSTIPITFNSNSSANFSWINDTPSIGLAGRGTGSINPSTGVGAINAFTATNTGTYTVTANITINLISVINGLSCVGASSTVQIAVNPTPVVNQISNLTYCNNSSTNAISFSGIATNYYWTNNNTSIGLSAYASSTTGINSFTATNTSSIPVTSTITVLPYYAFLGAQPQVNTSGALCYGASSSFTIAVNPTPAMPMITASGSTTFCQGNSITLTSSSGSSYLWSTGATTQAITASAGGNYSVAVTNANGCSVNSAATTVTVNPLPTITIFPNSISICSGAVSRPFTASGALTYNWFPNTGLSSGTGATVTASPSTTTTYTVTGTTAGCQGTALITVTVNPNPSVSITASPGINVCSQSIMLTAYPSGGTYAWSSDVDGTLGTRQTQPVSTGNVATFTVVVTVAGCSSSNSKSTVATGGNCRYQLRIDAGNPLPDSPVPDSELPTVDTITAYPNPASSIIDVAVPWRAMEDTPVLLYDLYGTPVATTILKKGEWKTVINVSGYAEGMYIVRLVTGDLINVTKVMVIHK
ncbi:MAG: T9SS type A sorting domain-containing protein [Bacteroidetes bacterium]|nr:T9SS type A sorting domain-containing protein [Bacteroidota bacterium]